MSPEWKPYKILIYSYVKTLLNLTILKGNDTFKCLDLYCLTVGFWLVLIVKNLNEMLSLMSWLKGVERPKPKPKPKTKF